MMIKQWILLAFILLSVSISFAQGQKPRRFIFLVHGLSGSKDTFGALPSILVEHGSVIQPEVDIKVVPVAYTTGKDSLTTYDFARHLGKQMKAAIGELRESDRLTLVAHSQGGLISWIWYLNSLSGGPFLKDYQALAKQTEGLMTLGSPMWGSKLATLANEFQTTRQALGKIGMAMGSEEVKEMSYSSDTIFRFRRKAVELDESGFQLPIRVLAVAGILPKHSESDVPLGLSFGIRGIEKYMGSGIGKIAETDLAVSLPSARFDFLYIKSGKNSEKEIRSSDFTHFRETKLGNFVIVRGPHMSFSQKTFFDVAEVPEACRDLSKPCTHPTYALILAFTMSCEANVKGCKSDQYDKLTRTLLETRDWQEKKKRADYSADNMHSFILDVVIDLPENYTFPKDKKDVLKYLKFPWVGKSRIQNVFDDRYYFVLDRKNEVLSKVVHMADFRLVPPHSPLEKQIRVTLHGQVYSHHQGDPAIFNSQAREGFKLPLKVEIPDLGTRQVEILVKPSYTTFIHLNYRD